MPRCKSARRQCMRPRLPSRAVHSPCSLCLGPHRADSRWVQGTLRDSPCPEHCAQPNLGCPDGRHKTRRGPRTNLHSTRQQRLPQIPCRTRASASPPVHNRWKPLRTILAGLPGHMKHTKKCCRRRQSFTQSIGRYSTMPLGNHSGTRQTIGMAS